MPVHAGGPNTPYTILDVPSQVILPENLATVVVALSEVCSGFGGEAGSGLEEEDEEFFDKRADQWDPPAGKHLWST